jgi:hypothetical protein
MYKQFEDRNNVDAKKTKSIVAIKPKPLFIPIFQVTVTKGGSNIRIINEPLRTQSGSPVVFLVELRYQ